MSDDLDSYRESVLDVARRAGNLPPADLFIRYHLDPRQVRDQEEFARRVEVVVKYWRKIKMQRKYMGLATALITADDELRRRKNLTYEYFEAQRTESRQTAQTRLDSRLSAIAESTPCLTLAGLQQLVRTMEGAFDEQEIRAALTRQRVSIVDPPWETITAAPVAMARSLRAPLTALGLRLSPELLFGTEAVRAGFTLRSGFRLADGRTVSLDRLYEFRTEHSRSKHDDRKTAIDNVLAVLITAAVEADALHQLLQWEVQEKLRPEVEAGLPVRAIARAAEELGLIAGEAIELAATLVGEGGGPRKETGVHARITEALRTGELHEASMLLAELPANEASEARAQLAEAQRQVGELVGQAEKALADGEAEQAAGLFTAAAQIARDNDTLKSRIAAIAPPAPTDVAAGSHAGKVTVRWTPSAARTPGVRYLVVRTADEPAVSSGAGTTVGESESNEITDTAPGVAEHMYYTVFATRGEGNWSSGQSARPIQLLPEVGDIELRGTVGSVSGSWRVHEAAVEVVVARRDRRSPDAPPQLVPTAANDAPSFVDRGVQNGHTYDYEFRAVYATRAGQRHMSQPVVMSATPTEPPSSVSELTHQIEADRDHINIRLSWCPPEHGTAEIRVSAAAPSWPQDILLDKATVRSFGHVASGEPTTEGNGRQTLVLPAPQGRTVLTVVVVAGDQARVGASVTVSLVDPVADLRTERFGNQVRLRWAWPQGANLARVSWHPQGTDSRTHIRQMEISRRVYSDSGGVRIDADPGPLMFSVTTVTRDRGEESVSSPVSAVIAGCPTKVTYRLRSTGMLVRRKHILELTCERSCRLPGLVVVHRADGIVPLRLESGTTITSLDPRDMTCGIPVCIPLPARVNPPSGLACFVDPGSPPADEVILVSAPVG